MTDFNAITEALVACDEAKLESLVRGPWTRTYRPTIS